LLSFKDRERMMAAFENILEDGWSVRQVEQVDKGTKPGSKTVSNQRLKLSAEQKQLKADLADWFGTKVDLKRNQQGKGKIEIPFKSQDDLQRIIEKLGL
jgi:ParB family chromosome partitioning protein